jgi:hypothetical protein
MQPRRKRASASRIDTERDEAKSNSVIAVIRVLNSGRAMTKEMVKQKDVGVLRYNETERLRSGARDGAGVGLGGGYWSWVELGEGNGRRATGDGRRATGVGR